MEYYHPARYFFKITMTEVSFVSGNADFTTCDEMYPLNSEQTIFINNEDVKSGDSFEQNQKIEGRVSSFWGKSFDSYQIIKSTDTDVNVEKVTDSNSKIGTYIMMSLIAIILVIIIIFFLRKNKK